MSNAVSKIVQRRAVGSPVRKAVLMYMAGCAGDDGNGIWPSKSRMAEELEMGRRTVQEAIEALLAARLIEFAGKRPHRNGYTDEYRIVLSNVEALPATGEMAPKKRKPAPAVEAADVPETTCAGAAPVREPHITCAGAAHQDVREPHINLHSTVIEPSSYANAGARDAGETEEPRAKRSRASQLPEGWTPSESNISYAVEKGLSEREIDREAEQFRNHHHAKGTQFKNWDAGWRTWVGNAARYAKPMAGGPHPGRDKQPSGIFGAVVRLQTARGNAAGGAL